MSQLKSKKKVGCSFLDIENNLSDGTKYGNLQHIIDSMPGIFFYRRNLATDKYDYISPFCEQLFGWSADDLCKMTIKDVLYQFIHPDDQVHLQDAAGAGGQWGMSFASGNPVRLDTSDKSVAIGDIAVDQATFNAYLASQTGLQGSGLTGFSIVYNTDPYITAGFSVTNLSAVTQTYTLIVSSPVVPIALGTLYGGSMSGSFTADPTAATVTTALNTPLYWGMIDGTPVLPIYNDPMSWTALPFASGDIAAVNVLPPTLAGPAVVNTISIQFKFTLTPGDIATMNGAFVVQEIPEPATLVLLGLGGLLVWRKK